MQKPNPQDDATGQINAKNAEIDRLIDKVMGIELNPKAIFKNYRLRILNSKIRKLNKDVAALRRNLARMQSKN